MSKEPRNILDILEHFFTRRKTPDEMIKTGILKEDPTQPQPGAGTGCYFNRFLSDVPKMDNIPCIVVECCEFLENNGLLLPVFFYEQTTISNRTIKEVCKKKDFFVFLALLKKSRLSAAISRKVGSF